MSMVATLKQISSRQLDELFDNCDLIEDLIFQEQENDNLLYIDKAWHGIHFLLNDDEWEGKEPLKFVIMGRAEIGEDIGYGPARYLTSEDVKLVSKALLEIPIDELRKKFDHDKFRKSHIYPSVWRQEDLEYLMEYYDLVVQYYLDASQQGNAMLIYLT